MTKEIEVKSNTNITTILILLLIGGASFYFFNEFKKIKLKNDKQSEDIAQMKNHLNFLMMRNKKQVFIPSSNIVNDKMKDNNDNNDNIYLNKIITNPENNDIKENVINNPDDDIVKLMVTNSDTLTDSEQLRTDIGNGDINMMENFLTDSKENQTELFKMNIESGDSDNESEISDKSDIVDNESILSVDKSDHSDDKSDHSEDKSDVPDNHSDHSEDKSDHSDNHSDNHSDHLEISNNVYADYKKMTVNQLKDELKKKNLPISGSKTKLINRLINYI